MKMPRKKVKGMQKNKYAQVAERSIACDCKSHALVATGVRIPPCAQLFAGVAQWRSSAFVKRRLGVRLLSPAHLKADVVQW